MERAEFQSKEGKPEAAPWQLARVRPAVIATHEWGSVWVIGQANILKPGCPPPKPVLSLSSS